MNDVDPLLRGQQGYRMWYLSCRKCRGRAVCKEYDDGTRVEFRVTVPHICISDAIAVRAKHIEDEIVQEATNPGANLTLRQIHERRTENLPDDIRKRVRTAQQIRSKVSKRRKTQLPPIPHNLRDLQIPDNFANLNRNGGERFFQAKLVIRGRGDQDETILLFATERFMKTLFTKRIVVADGGFKHAPRRFKQVSL